MKIGENRWKSVKIGFLSIVWNWMSRWNVINRRYFTDWIWIGFGLDLDRIQRKYEGHSHLVIDQPSSKALTTSASKGPMRQYFMFSSICFMDDAPRIKASTSAGKRIQIFRWKMEIKMVREHSTKSRHLHKHPTSLSGTIPNGMLHQSQFRAHLSLCSPNQMNWMNDHNKNQQTKETTRNNKKQHRVEVIPCPQPFESNQKHQNNICASIGVDRLGTVDFQKIEKLVVALDFRMCIDRSAIHLQVDYLSIYWNQPAQPTIVNERSLQINFDDKQQQKLKIWWLHA